jgi:hypothetical protein
MLSDRSFDPKVDRAIPGVAAVPDGSNTVCVAINPYPWASRRFQRLTCHLPSRQKHSTVSSSIAELQRPPANSILKEWVLGNPSEDSKKQ